MGLRYPSQHHFDWFFVSTTFVDWQRFGELPGFYGHLCESLIFYTNRYVASLCGYCLMPHHIHLILHIDGDLLGSFMRDYKKFISQKVAADYGLPGHVWMPRYDRVVLTSEKQLRIKLRYVHDNPVEAGLVRRAIDWPWSSAQDYFTEKQGPVPLFKGWC